MCVCVCEGAAAAKAAWSLITVLLNHQQGLTAASDLAVERLQTEGVLLQ